MEKKFYAISEKGTVREWTANNFTDDELKIISRFVKEVANNTSGRNTVVIVDEHYKPIEF